MKLTLKDAADYVRSAKAPKVFFNFLGLIKRIFTFTQERSNRLNRYIAITRAYQKGQSVKAIEDEYGCSRHTVLRYARMAELPKRPKHFPAEISKQVIEDYKKGINVATIAKLHGVSQAYVSKMARANGVSRYGPRPHKK